tara:strand:+ start:139208 stop:139504 length:297 start_codon:yes stop_codon:yes gene_type:complete
LKYKEIRDGFGWPMGCNPFGNRFKPNRRAPMITDREINMLAAYMVDTHGRKALAYADTAVAELEEIGEKMRADAWRTLRRVVEDMVEGRMSREGHILH